MNVTPKQRDLMLFVQRYVDREGCSPSYDEMKEAMRLKSKSGIHRMIEALEVRGFIARLPGRARALTILKRVRDSAAPQITDEAREAYRSLVRELANDPRPDFWAKRRAAQELVRRYG